MIFVEEAEQDGQSPWNPSA